MSTATDIVDRYMAAWNATGEEARRDLVVDAFAPEVIYLDPVMQGQGHAGIERLIAGAQSRFPGFRFRRTGSADSHNDHVRFSWSLGPDGQDPVIEGTDVARLAPDGRILSVVGFLDRVPAGAGRALESGGAA